MIERSFAAIAGPAYNGSLMETSASTAGSVLLSVLPVHSANKILPAGSGKPCKTQTCM